MVRDEDLPPHLRPRRPVERRPMLEVPLPPLEPLPREAPAPEPDDPEPRPEPYRHRW